ncbi:MAG: thiamine-phosphate kinase [Hyphomicrobiaceae bacterium]
MTPSGKREKVDGGEARIIREVFLPLTGGHPAARSLADDCAVLSPPPGHDLVLTTDALIEGVHFLPGDIPAFKALAVNVSDLVAKGAQPHVYLLAVALPGVPDAEFLDALRDGLAEAQELFGCRLVGGDTDRTPARFTLTITAVGLVPSGSAVSRGGARPGDRILVTGTIGDAGLGLLLRQQPALVLETGLTPAQASYLVGCFDKPVPPVNAAPLVRAHATAAMDVSDGLIKDLQRLAQASRVGARVELASVPISQAARQFTSSGRLRTAELLGLGEDYQVLMTVPAKAAQAVADEAAAGGISLTDIGEIVAGDGVQILDVEGTQVSLERIGWDHF